LSDDFFRPGKVIKVDSIDRLKYVPLRTMVSCDYCKTQYESERRENCRNCGAPVALTTNIALMWKGVYGSCGV
jgi:rRNA maturation endonuclease Nob1